MNIHIDSKLHDAFKATSAAQGEQMTTVLLRFIKEYIKKHQASRPSTKGGR